MSEPKLLEHHGTLIESLLRIEEYRIADGEQPRSSNQIAFDWYQSQGEKVESRYRTYNNPQRDQGLVDAVAKAIESVRNGENLETVSDFKYKRDSICEACPVNIQECWRKDDT